ncbi:uncharacterized protein [Cherax quadricarinatus]|uniref:uncharacterized protein n=1 Tax=Cherax quadricarinatus TaxID=27406 RepID=UPI00387E3109
MQREVEHEGAVQQLSAFAEDVMHKADKDVTNDVDIDVVLETVLQEMFPKSEETLTEVTTGDQVLEQGEACGSGGRNEMSALPSSEKGNEVIEVEVHKEKGQETSMVEEEVSRKRAAVTSDSDDVLTPAQRPGKTAGIEGVSVVAPPVLSSVNGSTAHLPQELLNLHQNTAGTTTPATATPTRNRGSNIKLGTKLDGTSSTPVEPIKPLLELALGDTSGSLTVPLHPVFDQAAPRNVTAMTDNSAYLHCLVHNLGNKSVSWIRQRDLHIMTVGRYTYTTDERFEVINSHGSKDWILKIKYAQVRDSGNYECQVSTKPVRSYVVHLQVYEPQAEIIGAPDIHVDKGSTINLTCIIRHGTETPAYIFWYHNDKVVNFESSRGGISVISDHGNSTSAFLLIQDARESDTGNYTCAPSNTAASSLRVHVLNGETPAAMQTNRGASGLASPSSLLLLQVGLLALLLVLTWYSLKTS